MKTAACALATVVMCSVACNCLAANGAGDSLDDKAKAIIRARVKAGANRGLVAGLVDRKGWRVYAAGDAWDDRRMAFGRDTVFEIGSITKVFTGLMLARAVKRGEVSLDDPVINLLPPAKYASGHLAKVTLLDLATHTGGLPAIFPGFNPPNPLNPYADIGREKLLDWLRRDPAVGLKRGTFQYSNLGMGLLGFALAQKAGLGYRELLTRDVLEPLKLKGSGVAPGKETIRHMAQGHNAAGEPMPRWDFQALAGAGAMYSTPRDLLRFLGGFLGLAGSPSLPEEAETVKPRREGPDKVLKVGLGWMILSAFGKTLVFHDGGTGGFRGFLGFCRESGLGVVILSNSSVDVTDIGLHLLAEQIPLRKVRQAVELARDLLMSYAGRYRVAEGGVIESGTILSIGLDEKGLTYGQGKEEPVAIKAQSKTEFFFPQMWDARITFDLDSKGKVQGLTLNAGAETIRAVRLR